MDVSTRALFDPPSINGAFVTALENTPLLRKPSNKRLFQRPDGPRRLNAPAVNRTLGCTYTLEPGLQMNVGGMRDHVRVRACAH